MSYPASRRALDPSDPIAEPTASSLRAPDPCGERLEEIWLLGQPPLGRLIEFVDDTVVDAATMDRAALVAEWSSANDYYLDLERTEAGIANEGSHRELDACFKPLAEAVAADPSFKLAFATLPTTFGMVELDRLIACQMHVTRNWIDALRTRLGPAPDYATLFRTCMPLGDASAPPVQIQRVGSRRYVFRSPSTDVRFLEPTLLRGEQVSGYQTWGAIAGIVGLVVGSSTNMLNVIRVGRRMLLNNAYHRAVTLRAMGITHAPCVIQTATRGDELQLAARSRVAENPEFYFESARPPLLKDFFDPKIRKLLPIHARMRHIEVSFEVKDYLVSD